MWKKQGACFRALFTLLLSPLSEDKNTAMTWPEATQPGLEPRVPQGFSRGNSDSWVAGLKARHGEWLQDRRAESGV